MKLHPVWNALSHATAIGSVMFLIFLCIDRVNPAMDFLGSSLSKWCLLAYCITSMLTALCSAIYLFKRSKAGIKHRPSHRQTADVSACHDPKQTMHRSRHCGGTGWNAASGAEMRNASLDAEVGRTAARS